MPPLFSKAWFDGVKYGAQIEGGFTFNGDRPTSGIDVGDLVTDHANQATLNQALLTVQRAPDPKATGYDFGFAVQLMYGSDARYYHYLGELDRDISDRYQLSFIQANISAHLPWLTAGGIDAKAGQYPTPARLRGHRPLRQPVLQPQLPLQLRPAVRAHRLPGHRPRQRHPRPLVRRGQRKPDHARRQHRRQQRRPPPACSASA